MSISGIYKIVNKKNKMFYLGRSIDIEKRFTRHIYELRKNSHHCDFLQMAWNKYGENYFEFVIIKQGLTKAEATLLEAAYLKKI
ncbi:GIY-YIG nuclease family protein [Pseudalkalibacillus decolorationis]|uniref:GIY-YIG nuclease family protein n=1 Tax=Pseudalkalibacillus decolorationis TaxID=163879 RepID=UPI0021481839|nr:GIY-YIG nuclease family protein [Pseudalkalibacillus decolorationis]